MSRRVLGGISIGLALAVGVGHSSIVAAAPGSHVDEAAIVRASVAIEAEGVGSAAPVVERRLRERIDVILRRGEVLPARSPEDPTIRIDVDALEGDDLGYAYRIVVRQDGRDIEGTERSSRCSLCTETELVGRVEDEVAKMLPRMREALQGGASQSSSQTAVDGDALEHNEPGDAADDSDRSGDTGAGSGGGLTASAKAGIALTVSGAVVAAVGIGLVARKPTLKRGDPTTEVYTQPPGYALLGVGAAAIVSGAVVLIVDYTLKRRRGSAASARIPTVEVGFSGVSITGRF